MSLDASEASLIVERTSDTVVTVSGTPTADVSIVVPDATAASSTYMVEIPAKVAVANSGWNPTEGVRATGTLWGETAKVLTRTTRYQPAHCWGLFGNAAMEPCKESRRSRRRCGSSRRW